MEEIERVESEGIEEDEDFEDDLGETSVNKKGKRICEWVTREGVYFCEWQLS